jgi:HTH-type transcriptional regulator/antitoxin HigA
MTIADTAAAFDADKVLAAWRPLHELVGLSAIRGEVEYQRMLRLTNLLLDQIGGDETHPLMGLLDLVSDLVEKYEDEHRPIPKASPIEVLRFLMKQGGLRQEDLKDCAPQGYISEVLAGKRSISKQVAKKLAASFKVSPELFI